MKKLTENNCIKCNYPLFDSVYEYSKSNIGFCLCKKCQDWYREKGNKPTWETKILYLALKERNVPVEIEKNDGFKSIDLAIPQLKFNIEVDGSQHNIDLNQACSDLLRTMFSFEKDFVTLRIPNVLVRKRLNETVDAILSMLLIQKNKLFKEYSAQNSYPIDEFEKLVKEFVIQFHVVFDSDWVYTHNYITEEGQYYDNLITGMSFGSNWGNRDNMVQAFFKLIEFMKKNEIFEKYKNEGVECQYESLFYDEFVN